jgi:hypothetical protein
MHAARPQRWLAIASFLLVVTVAGRLLCQPRPAFRDLGGLKAWAEAHGLHCCSDAATGPISTGMAVSTRPLTWLEVGSLPPRTVPITAPWRGILWAQPAGRVDRRQPGRLWSACRHWGDLHVTGDPELLDRIEHEANLRP